jgi:hypothetical protein
MQQAKSFLQIFITSRVSEVIRITFKSHQILLVNDTCSCHHKSYAHLRCEYFQWSGKVRRLLNHCIYHSPSVEYASAGLRHIYGKQFNEVVGKVLNTQYSLQTANKGS